MAGEETLADAFLREPRRYTSHQVAEMAGVPVYVFMKWRGLRSAAPATAAPVTPPSDGDVPLGLSA